MELAGDKYSPEDIVELALKNGCESISYTYTEPTIFFEFAYKTAKLAYKDGIMNIFVTNGYMSDVAVKKIAKYLDAAVVDFKASGDPEFYKKFVGVPDVQPIYTTLDQMKKHRIFIEITDLIIPNIGEDIAQLKKLVEWINTFLGPDVPLHILQFFPSYKLMEIPVTPIQTLEKFLSVAKEAGQRYVYIGNVPGHKNENTYCYNCGELIIERHGFRVKKINISEGRCAFCGFRINIRM
jgi:pyruvate formate lyase activating enzyme